MKDKKLLYVLLPAVVVIWLVIGYRFYNAVKGEEPSLPIARPTEAMTAKKVKTSYRLQLDYPDPFLKEEKLVRTTPSPLSVYVPPTANPVVLPEPKQAISSVDWTTINYLGMIENGETNRRLGIFTVNNERKLIEENAHVYSFTIEQILRDSAKVRFNEETKYILREGRIEWMSKIL